MRLIRVCVVASLLVFALNPVCHALAGSDEKPVATGEDQTDSN